MGLFGAPNIANLEANRDVKGLIKVLKNQKNASINKSAAEALVRIGDFAVLPLIADLKKKDVNIFDFNQVVQILGRIGDARVVEPFLEILEKGVLYKNKTVVNALDQMGWLPGLDERFTAYWRTKIDTIKPDLKATLDERKAAVDNLVQIGAKLQNFFLQSYITETLILDLDDLSAGMRKTLFAGLGELGANIKNENLRSRITETLLAQQTLHPLEAPEVSSARTTSINF